MHASQEARMEALLVIGAMFIIAVYGLVGR